MQKVVTTDLKTLHKLSQDVPMDDVKTVHMLRDNLLKAYERLDGKLQGMAAIQLSLPYKAILLRYKKGEAPIVIFNPRVIWKSGNRTSNEGCLSEEGRWLVQRPLFAKVQYQLETGKVVTTILSYRKARIFMHEYDHLNGILLQDIGERVHDES